MKVFVLLIGVLVENFRNVEWSVKAAFIRNRARSELPVYIRMRS